MTPGSIQNQTCPEELLPWYVNQTLSASEHDAVKAHLEHCVRCQQEVTWLQKVRNEVKASPFRPPGELGLRRLMHRVQTVKEAPARQQVRRSGWWRPALAIAASLVIVLQAGLLLRSWFGPAPVRLLSDTPANGVILQVTFSPTTTELQFREILNAIHGTIVGGPGALGVYRIRLAISHENTGAIEKALAQLKAQENIVTHVTRE